MARPQSKDACQSISYVDGNGDITTVCDVPATDCPAKRVRPRKGFFGPQKRLKGVPTKEQVAIEADATHTVCGILRRQQRQK